MLPSETGIFRGPRGGGGGGGGGGRERRVFVVILEAAPVQTVVVTVLSSRGSCRSRTVNVKDLLPLFFFLSFFYRCK